MSLLTRCPACTTVYRVVPDQLRISQGWVKCGQCGDIFDATQHLIQAAIEPEEEQVAPPSELTEPVASGSHELISESVVETDQIESVAEVESLDVVPASDLSDQTAAEPLVSESVPGLDPETVEEISPAPEVDMDAWPRSVTPVDETLDAPLTSVAREDSKEHADDLVQISFMKGAERPSFWQRAPIRVGLSLLVALLSLGLVGQWMVQERHRLVALHPDLKPVLHVFCNVLACSVGPLQQIESIAIDSAAFHTLGADRYRLSFTLKNSAYLPVALPSIELTLTDALEQPVIRRVWTSAELAAVSDRLEPTSEWPVTMIVKVNAGASGPKVVGYRLLAFYP